MITAFFFVWFFVAALWTINALRRPVTPGQGFPPLWLPGMIISEGAPWFVILRALVAWAFVSAGAADLGIGKAGLVLFVGSELGMLPIIARSYRSVAQLGQPHMLRTLFRTWERLPKGIAKLAAVEYWDGHTLDIYRNPDLEKCPVLIYVHPGSWMRGRPGRQARPMFHRLVENGWVVLDITYPLSPAATFPEHLVGVKRAIAWARSQGSALGIDPRLVAISGGSSGAHLAALAALTWDRADLQPGFESHDTSVFACVPYYGIYDLFVRNPTRYDWPFIAQVVLKATRTEAPDLYRLGSPVDQARSDAPPFLVIHGEFDSVVLPEESRHFVDALRACGAEVEHLKIVGAQHGFDAIASMRTRATGIYAARWLNQQSLTLREGP